VKKAVEKHTYVWNKVVIGGTLDALIQAYKTDSHIIINHVDGIFPYDAIGDYEDLGLDCETNYELWQSLSYELSMRGLNPFGLDVASVRIEENKIEVITRNNHSAQIKASEACLHSLENISGIDHSSDKPTHYRVFDWFNVRAGMSHKYDIFERKDNFCNKFYFYLSERIDGNKKYKDLVVESKLTTEQLRDPEYSDSVSRLISTRIMKDLGIHKNPVLETHSRDLIPVRKKVYYELSFGGHNSG